MYPSFFKSLKCPACESTGEGWTIRSLRLECDGCGREFENMDGYVDLLDLSVRGDLAVLTPEQRLMESELIARVYERFWRPTFVRVMAGSGARRGTGGFPGELFIHKNSLGMEDRGGPWLDLSCGSGLFTRGMAASAPTELVIGLDISRAMLEVAARRVKGYENVVLVRADAHNLPFADGSMNGVNNSSALHSYDDTRQAFLEIRRVLRPGGLYVASTYSKSQSIMGRFASRIAGIRRFDAAELQAQLSRIGFADYEEIHFGNSFVFRVRKP